MKNNHYNHYIIHYYCSIIRNIQIDECKKLSIIWRFNKSVETNEKVIALTFDDGPTNNVKQILPLLDTYNAKATFFLIGNELEKNLSLGKSIVQSGHQVGNHTYSHNRMVLKHLLLLKKK